MNKIPYGKQEVLAEDIEAVEKVLKSDFLTQGPLVDQFENDFAKLVSSRFAVSVNNATAGLHLSVLALGLKPGQKVLCPTISFVASANCIRYAGGEVEFVDIDPSTYCIDIQEVEKKLLGSPQDTYAGIIIVHLAGYPANTEELSQVVRKYNLWIIEDSCHAPGAKFLDSKNNWSLVGSCDYSDISVFSFHPVKHICTGEGGMITTQRPEIFQNLLKLRSHGIERNPARTKAYHGGWYYEMQQLGFNYRLPDILCALGISQIKRLNHNLKRRNEIADRYDRELPVTITRPSRDSNIFHAFHLYIIQSDRRNELYEHLKTRNIYSQIHYIPIHQQPYYVERYGSQLLQNSQNYYSRALSLPMYHSLTEVDQASVIREVASFFKGKN